MSFTGENTRYDLAIERNGELSRVQCKTGRLKKGAVYFRTASSSGSTTRRRSG